MTETHTPMDTELPISPQSQGSKSLEYDDVLRLAPDMFNPEYAFLPITEEDVSELLQANPTGEIRKTAGMASGKQRGLKASQQCAWNDLQIESAAWLLVDVNVHIDDRDALTEYDGAVEQMLTRIDEEMNVICGLRKNGSVVGTVEVTMISGVYL